MATIATLKKVGSELSSFDTWFHPFDDSTGHIKHMPAVLVLYFSLFVLFVVTLFCATALGKACITPPPMKGWGGGSNGPGDYEQAVGKRKSLSAYLSVRGVSGDTSVPMVNFSVATANFGGIYTENMGFLNPWIGTVSPDAARLQVEGGARAIVLDVWPNPADNSQAVVASMVDMRANPVLNTWMNSWGLGKGLTGSFSNWQRLTRNVAPVGDVLAAAIDGAFQSGAGQQNSDPFFVLLNLHGPMTVPYLNRLGTIVQQALGEYAMPSQWGRAANQAMICKAPVSEFMGQAFLIVNPDIATSLGMGTTVGTLNASKPRPLTAPNASQFIRQFMTTTMGEVTNAIQSTTGSIRFEPGDTGALTAATQPNCVVGGDSITPTEAGFCVVQPSIGGASTDNTSLFTKGSFISCLQTGAQFVAVNLFSPNSSDSTLSDFFDPLLFGTYSFLMTRP